MTGADVKAGDLLRQDQLKTVWTTFRMIQTQQMMKS
jgi:hypothetical protein